MIDIHCHLLYGVDDGPKSREESVEMLQEAARQGITDIILTPHYRRGMFRFHVATVENHYRDLESEAETLGIRLHLGTEIHVNGDIVEYLDAKKVFSLAGTEYVLTEYGYDTEYSDMFRMTQELLRHGYTPVIAHVERYRCLVEKPGRIDELREIGALIQCNAAAVLGKDGWRAKQYCKRLLQNAWVDIVASDSHDMRKRACYMAKCYNYLSGKYGEKTALRLMEKNPMKILSE